jgi:hypothetical protein
MRFLTDPALARSVQDSPHTLEDLVASLLRQGQELGQVNPDLDPQAEAAFLVAGAQGLQPPVLLGQYTPQFAVDVIDRQIDRLVAGSTAKTRDQRTGPPLGEHVDGG